MKSPVKWAGGKARVLPEILKYAPKECARYVEPFLGSGTVFLGYKGKQGAYPILNDANWHLINAYRCLRTDKSKVFEILGSDEFANTKEAYATIRGKHSKDQDMYWMAARFFYLNRAAFNGLWRENKRGEFNVPFGHYKRLIFPWKGLEEMSTALFDVALTNKDYREVLSLSYLPEWDRVFVYLDPPYDPLTVTSSFTGYQAGGFTPEDQGYLADTAANRVREGAYVIASNHDTPRIRQMWGDTGQFEIFPIEVKRSIAAKGSSRKAVGEVLIVSKNLV